MLNSQKIRHEPTPTYLGVTLDHSLTFKEHLTRTAKKYWQNLPAQVGEPIRRSFAPLSLHYATQLLNIVPLSGHDLLIWVCSQLNSTMQIITATLKPTPTPWLPVLANIAPPSLRWKEATDKLILKISDHSYWPIYKDIYEHPDQRLVSRTPLWNDLEPCDLASQWRESWETASAINSSLVTDPTIRLPGFDLPRHEWSLLNRFCTAQGHCRACRKMWRLADDDIC
jgi:hypothetical protein